MKTRERILSTSLALFNREGEADQSAVDISNEIGISPGNLYYHFKGKDAIIRALYDRFEEEVSMILAGSRGGLASLEDNWVFLYIILEEIYDFRFFYRELGLLLARYPDLSKRFRRIIAAKRSTIETILDDMADDGRLMLDPRLKNPLIEQILMTLTFWLNQEQLRGNTYQGPALIHETVFQIMTLFIPYMGEAGFEVLGRMTAHRDAAIGKA